MFRDTSTDDNISYIFVFKRPHFEYYRISDPFIDTCQRIPVLQRRVLEGKDLKLRDCAGRPIKVMFVFCVDSRLRQAAEDILCMTVTNTTIHMSAPIVKNPNAA